MWWRAPRTVRIADAVAAALLSQMLAQQLAGARIEQAHEHRVPLHMHLAADPTRRRSVVSRLHFNTAIQMNRALAVLVVAERLQRQRLQRRASLRRTSPPPAAWSGHGCACRPSVLPSDRDTPAPLPGSRTACPSAASSVHGRHRFRLSLFDLDPAPAGQRRHAVVRQNIAIERIQARIVDVGRQHAFAKIIQNHHPRDAAQAGGRPSRATRPISVCWNGSSAVEPTCGCSPASARTAACAGTCRSRIAHHRPGAVIDLALFTGLRSG